MRRLTAFLLPILPLQLLAGCSGPQSSLDPKGPQADALANLFWIFLAVAAVVWLLVVLVLLVALTRRHGERPDPLVTVPRTERRFGIVVTSLALLTGIVVIALSVLSFSAQAQLFGQAASGLTLKIIGHQWWWEVQYEDPDPSRTITTANEIHLPVGEPVTIKLTSGDVIHSFWVPSLMGKMDAITGRENQIQFTVDEPGIYRGQCAEFCGMQHAHMAILVFAESRSNFDAWRAGQVAATTPPDTDARKQGEKVFLSHPCVACHTVRGTPAGGRTGPDLTHLASRTTLGAGTLPLTRGSLAAWITDPQSSKPGVHMPLITMAPDDLQPLLDYLEGLK
jgi:cytochrome c oxidase subunit 2